MADPKLVARIEANLKQFEQQLDRADKLSAKMIANTERNFERLGGTISQHATRIATAFAAAFSVAQLAGFVRRMAATGNEVGDTAERIGITAEKLQLLHYWVRLAGGQTEEFDKAILTMSRQLADSDTEVTDFTLALNKLGLRIADLRGQPIDVVLDKIAERFALLKNVTTETQVATGLFGDQQGQKLIPALRKGADGIKAASDEMRKFGLVTSESGIKTAKQTNDEITRLDIAFQKAGLDLANTLLPAIIRFREVATNPEFQAGIKRLADGIVTIVEFAGKNPKAIAALLGGGAGAMVGRVAGVPGAIAGAAIGAGVAVKGLESDLEKTDNEIDKIDGSLGRMRKTLTDAQAQGLSLTVVDMMTQINKAEGERNALVVKRAALEAKAREETERAAAAAKAPQERIPVKPVDFMTPLATSEQISNAVRDIGLKAKLAGAEFVGWDDQFKQLLLTIDPAKKAIEVIGGDISKWPANIALANDAFKQMTARNDMTEAAKAFGQAWTKEIENVIFEAKSMGDAMRSLSKEIAKIILRMLVLKPLERALSGGFTSIFGIPIPGKQHGGPVVAGKPYIVGEAGPELFVPQHGGKIVPNAVAANAGGGVTIGGSTVVINGSAGDREIVAIKDVLANHERKIASTQRAMIRTQRMQSTGVA